jgi:hypothetical protein
MQLAIPHAPRAVRLVQVPGAVRRLAVAAALGTGLCVALGLAGTQAGRWLSDERAFLQRAEEVEGTVARVHLPPWAERERADATLDVIYGFGGLSRSVRGVPAHALYAEGLGEGAQVRLLVDPASPEQPREAGWARARGSVLWLLPVSLGLGLAVALALLGREMWRVYRRELEPLRKGALVWLTPDQPLSRSRRELTFAASYHRDDRKHEVRVRGRPGRGPVRNGDKVLGAVVPKEPGWARLVDEDLARTLGWVR